MYRFAGWFLFMRGRTTETDQYSAAVQPTQTIDARAIPRRCRTKSKKTTGTGTRTFFLERRIASPFLMSRQPRTASGVFVYQALNRAVGRLPLLQQDGDSDAFLRVLGEARREHPTPLLGSRVMPNHWHFVLRPRRDGELTDLLRWLTHPMRWLAPHPTVVASMMAGRWACFIPISIARPADRAKDSVSARSRAVRAWPLTEL
jgi:hypothetical protein